MLLQDVKVVMFVIFAMGLVILIIQMQIVMDGEWVPQILVLHLEMPIIIVI